MAEPRISTSEVARAAGVSQATVQRWARLGLLPAPTVYYGLKPGKHSFWPAHAPAQAAWVAGEIQKGRSFVLIKAALEAGEFKPEPVAGD